MAKKNLAICVPSGKLVDFGFFQSYSNSIGQLMLGYNTATFTVASPMIFENRNEIMRRVEKFEKSSNFAFDYLLWIDNDITFTSEQVQKLLSYLEGEEDFVSGTYYNPRDSGIRPVAYWRDGEGYKWLEEKELGAPKAAQGEGKGLMEVDAVGFGFCAMKTDLARKVAEKFAPRPFNLRMLADGSLVSEDQLFCERAKELGYKIWLDSSIVVRHAKGYLPR